MITKQFTCLATALSLGSLTAFLAIAPASMANPISTATAAKEQSSSTLRQGIPGRRLGGGTRNETIFANAADNLVALTSPNPLTITAAKSPRLLFYIPEMIESNNVEFVVLNDQDELVYEKTFVVEPEAGIVSIELTNGSEASALNLDTDYQWYFSIVPNANDRASDMVVHGSIRQVDPVAWFSLQAADANFNKQLQAAEPLAKVRMLYQQANLWQDAIALLDELRQAEPENVAIENEWNQLLESAGLSNNIQMPTTSVQISLN